MEQFFFMAIAIAGLVWAGWYAYDRNKAAKHQKQQRLNKYFMEDQK